MSSAGKVFVAFVVLIAGFILIMKITMPKDSGPSDAEVKAYSRTTDGIQATCGRPDRTWSDSGSLGGTLTYAYDTKGAYVHFMALDGRPLVAVSVSRGKRTYALNAPEVANILPCAMR